MIKAILFDMVGVILFKKDEYKASSQDKVNADEIENIFLAWINKLK